MGIKTEEVPLVSIIIPVFNGEKYLPVFFKELRKLTYNHLQIIFINDGSSDNSRIMLQEYVDEDARAVLINKDNAGVSAARNDGLKKAVGKYLFFFDCDDSFEQDIVGRCVSFAEMRSYDTVIYNVKNITPDGCVSNHSLSYVKSEYSGEDTIQLAAYSVGTSFDELYRYLSGKRSAREGKERNGPWRMMYSREIIEKYELHFSCALRIGEDTVFTNEYLCMANNVGILRETLYYLHINSGSAITSYNGDWKRMIPQKIELINEKEKWTARMKEIGYSVQDFWGGEYVLSSIQLGLLIATDYSLSFNNKCKALKQYHLDKNVQRVWQRIETRKLIKCKSTKAIAVLIMKKNWVSLLMAMLVLLNRCGIRINT